MIIGVRSGKDLDGFRAGHIGIQLPSVQDLYAEQFIFFAVPRRNDAAGLRAVALQVERFPFQIIGIAARRDGGVGIELMGIR